jgi:hypothetical protein
MFHQAPPCDDDEGWIEYEDVPLRSAYTLQHQVLMTPDYLFDPVVTAKLREIQPVEPLTQRFSWRYMLDKMMFTLRNTTDGWRQYENASMTGGKPEPFGFYAKNWYAITAPPGIPTYEDIEHSPDWGASFDAWSAVFMALYANEWGDHDGWVARRLPLLRRGLSLDGWQQHSTPALQGAFWQCFAPWNVSKAPNQRTPDPGFHMAHFIEHVNHVWVCDSGKTGAFLLKLHALTPGGDPVLVTKAEAAGRFLQRHQLPSGDLTGSVYNSDNGTVTKPSNFAGVVTSILLWAELHNATRDTRWLDAAANAMDWVRCRARPPPALDIVEP